MELHKHFKLNSMLRYITVILFIASTTVNAEITATYDEPNEKLRFYDVVADNSMTLECTSSAKLQWTKNGKELGSIEALKDEKKNPRYEISGNKLIIKKLTFGDDGKYTCTDPETKESAEINVVANVYIKKLHENLSVIEGENLKLTCTVLGTEPEIEWRVAKEIRQEDLTKANALLGQDKLRYEPVESLLDDRISFEDSDKIPRAILVINGTTLDDRGRYNCTARNKATETSPRFPMAERGCYVRIKGKLAALWPFLGICAEVLILCAIILVYEKRRNKEGADESDTDQSPEQEKLKTGK